MTIRIPAYTVSNSTGIRLRDSLVSQLPLSSPETPTAKPAKEWKGKIVWFSTIWRRLQPSGFFFRTKKDWVSPGRDGIAVKAKIRPNQRIRIATLDSTWGGTSIGEKSISFAPGDYQSALSHGVGNYSNASYRNKTNVIQTVYLNFKISNHSEVTRAAAQLQITQT